MPVCIFSGKIYRLICFCITMNIYRKKQEQKFIFHFLFTEYFSKKVIFYIPLLSIFQSFSMLLSAHGDSQVHP